MLEINGKEYEIKFPINTLCLMSEDGIDIMKMEVDMINIRLIRDLFYYGLKHENKKITKNQAGDLIDDYIAEGGLFNDLGEILIEALMGSLGKAPEKVAEEESEEGK